MVWLSRLSIGLMLGPWSVLASRASVGIVSQCLFRASRRLVYCELVTKRPILVDPLDFSPTSYNVLAHQHLQHQAAGIRCMPNACASTDTVCSPDLQQGSSVAGMMRPCEIIASSGHTNVWELSAERMCSQRCHPHWPA